MNVSYLAPLQRSWERARRLLFSPFRIETWVVAGFAAFLSEWLSGGFGTGGFTYNLHARDVPADVERLRSILGNPFWVAVLLWSLLGLLVLLILFQWISARGKFVFLDDVAHARPAIREPWTRYARLGDSLFVFRLVFLFIAAGLFIAVLGAAAVHTLRAVMADEADLPALLTPLLGTLVLAGLLALLVAFVALMLDSFVVPLMYRHHIGVLPAWGKFLPLLGQHPLAFVTYAIFVFLLALGLVVAIFAVGILTCCIGFILLGLPYVSSVVLLPVHALFRGLGPEFLAQFGIDFDPFADARAEAAAASPSEPAPPAPPGTPAP